MAHRGAGDQRMSHRLIFQRLCWQALTVLLLLVLGALTQIR